MTVIDTTALALSTDGVGGGRQSVGEIVENQTLSSAAAYAAEEGLRPEIAISWWRSQMLGVKPEVPVGAVPSEPMLDADERLRLAVQPVLDELATKLAGTNSAIILADHRAVILDRRGTSTGIEAALDRFAVMPGFAFGEGAMGTNAIGTAAEERKLVRVAGAEHYAEILKGFSCYGVPLVHPLNRRLVGVLDLTFPPREEHPLMASFMADAGRRIEMLLAEWASIRERVQFECFLALGRRSRRPVLSMMGDAILLNRSARELHPVDQAALLRAADEVAEAGHGAVVTLSVGSGEEPVPVRVHTRSDEANFPGVVLEVLPRPRSRSPRLPEAVATLPGLAGTSQAWTTFCAAANRAVAADQPVLLAGEPGTGKLAAARALHELTGRPRLTVLDAASVLAEGGPKWLQALRRALADTEATTVVRHLELCDAALAAAAAAEIDRVPKPGSRLMGTLNTGAETAGARHATIQALLDRFCLRLAVPPLRDRGEDLGPLVQSIARRHGADPSVRFHPETLALLRSVEFPGNVRELEAVIAGVVATRRVGDVLPGDLPSLAPAGPAHLTPMERAEREAIVKALQEANGKMAPAAAVLGISRPTLYRKLARYGINPG